MGRFPGKTSFLRSCTCEERNLQRMSRPSIRRSPMAGDNSNLQQLVAEVAAAYFSNSHVSPSEIPNVVAQIAHSLAGVGSAGVQVAAAAVAEPVTQQAPPAQVRKSITPDALISFEDSKPYKTLKRHLAVRGLSPA